MIDAFFVEIGVMLTCETLVSRSDPVMVGMLGDQRCSIFDHHRRSHAGISEMGVCFEEKKNDEEEETCAQVYVLVTQDVKGHFSSTVCGNQYDFFTSAAVHREWE